MQRCTQRERYEFIHLMMKHTQAVEGEVQRVATRLLRYGATLGRIAEFECNSPDYPAMAWQMPEAERLAFFKRIDDHYQCELDRMEKKEERIQAAATKLCESIGCKPDFQGDPRGNTLKIIVPDGYTNDWGHTGICVPTS